ncbi:hypothetical protein B5F40_00125 [Gordonibacter sp. An230]|uniref:endonuclease domain-containing protein n=1 Tax=Gordonibacter sp. An230 TaxID=1965592 RepID=UPI000B3719FC|nr:endonuclease domain-containing protein [Gordonibacter sp. An230]OUO92357.1 hypothetical protein B5F40_00125 [Gordonibacter sp. An230]
MNQARRQLLAQRAENMRKQMTSAEKMLWFRFLREYHISFVPQKVIGDFIVDFYCRRVRLSIEIDGESHYRKIQQQYDQARTLYLETLEIKELRFTNNEIYESFEGVCEVIHDEVEKRRTDTHNRAEAFAALTRKR